MNRRRWYYKNGTCFEEFDILFDNGRFMLVQNVKTKVFSFGVCENFGTLYGFPVNWSCLTKDQAIERLNNMIRIDMDEATPHVHIDFVPYITGSKRSMDTRVSLKQALAQLGFKGGTRSATEWNQWAQSEKQVLAEIMLEHGIEWEQLGTHEEHLSVLDYKKQERAKEVRALDTTIAEKQTQVSEIEQTLQSVQKQVVDLDKIENVSVKKALLSDKVTLPRNDFENLLSAAKQYVVYRRQDESLQGLLDAANAKIKQLEGIIGELKQKISKLVSELSNIEFWHTQELNEVKSESREVRRENLMLKHEQKGLVNLLRRHGIDPAKERIRQQEHDER